MSERELLPIDYGFNRVTGQPFRQVNLLGGSVKTKKGEKWRVDTKVLYMLPAQKCRELVQKPTGMLILKRIVALSMEVPWLPTTSEESLLEKAFVWNACTHADKCKEDCLATTSGHLSLDDNQMFMLAKTLLFLAFPHAFEDQLHLEIERHGDDVYRRNQRAKQRGCRLPKWEAAVRLNGGADIEWSKDLYTRHRDVIYYDYTKVESRMTAYLGGSTYPENYYLTFSWGSSNDRAVARVLLGGGNVAVVVRDPGLRGLYKTDGVRVGDRTVRVPEGTEDTPHYGDVSDIRYRDPQGSLIFLSPKGPVAKKDRTTGFVKRDVVEISGRLASSLDRREG